MSVKKIAYATFGRFNPPTFAHGQLFDLMRNFAWDYQYKYSSENPHIFIFASVKSDNNTNPLFYYEKMDLLRKLYPNCDFNSTRMITSPSTMLEFFNREGYNEVNLFAGDDRITKYKDFLNYTPDGKKETLYNFKLNLHSAGHRDPDTEDVTGLSTYSATKARDAARRGDIGEFFSITCPTVNGTSNFKLLATLYNSVRRGLGLDENTDEY